MCWKSVTLLHFDGIHGCVAAWIQVHLINSELYTSFVEIHRSLSLLSGLSQQLTQNFYQNQIKQIPKTGIIVPQRPRVQNQTRSCRDVFIWGEATFCNYFFSIHPELLCNCHEHTFGCTVCLCTDETVNLTNSVRPAVVHREICPAHYSSWNHCKEDLVLLSLSRSCFPCSQQCASERKKKSKKNKRPMTWW